MRVLVVEDNKDQCEKIVKYLSNHFINCDNAASLEEGMHKVYINKYDVVIVDLGLGDGHGSKLIQQIRLERTNDRMGIIVLSADHENSSVIQSFLNGVEDYIKKPCSLAEVLARIKCVARRNQGGSPTHIKKISDLTIDFNKRKIFLLEQDLMLTNKQYHLIEYLINNIGKVVHKQEILNELYNEKVPTHKIIDVLICNTRKRMFKTYCDLKKLDIDIDFEKKSKSISLKKIEAIMGEENFKQANYIETAWGTGYTFIDPSQVSQKPISNLTNKQTAALKDVFYVLR